MPTGSQVERLETFETPCNQKQTSVGYIATAPKIQFVKVSAKLKIDILKVCC